MTTIAVKGGVMAADMQATGNYLGSVQKVVRLQNGTIVGGAGALAQVTAAFKWLEGGRKKDEPDISESLLLFLKPDGTIWLADSSWPEFQLEDPYAAIGSGSLIAMYIMTTGGDAVAAVEGASLIDPYTGPEIQYCELQKKKRKKKK